MDEDFKSMELLFVEEVAAYLKFSTAYIYRLCKEKKIPHVNYGRHIIFRKCDLFSWLGSMVCYEPRDDGMRSMSVKEAVDEAGIIWKRWLMKRTTGIFV